MRQVHGHHRRVSLSRKDHKESFLRPLSWIHTRLLKWKRYRSSRSIKVWCRSEPTVSYPVWTQHTNLHHQVFMIKIHRPTSHRTRVKSEKRVLRSKLKVQQLPQSFQLTKKRINDELSLMCYTSLSHQQVWKTPTMRSVCYELRMIWSHHSSITFRSSVITSSHSLWKSYEKTLITWLLLCIVVEMS